MISRHKIAEGIAKFRLRYGRGESLLGFLQDIIKSIVYLGGLGFLFNKWFGIDPAPAFLLIVALLLVVAYWILGYLDEKAGFWKFENSYGSKQLNPFMEELSNRTEEIKKLLEEKHG